MENLFIEHFLSYEDFRSNKEIQALELNEEEFEGDLSSDRSKPFFTL